MHDWRRSGGIKLYPNERDNHQVEAQEGRLCGGGLTKRTGL
jgi:hypothetical protein